MSENPSLAQKLRDKQNEVIKQREEQQKKLKQAEEYKMQCAMAEKEQKIQGWITEAISNIDKITTDASEKKPEYSFAHIISLPTETPSQELERLDQALKEKGFLMYTIKNKTLYKFKEPGPKGTLLSDKPFTDGIELIIRPNDGGELLMGFAQEFRLEGSEIAILAKW